MGQAVSFHDAEHALAWVPMLDWPSDLFGDNVSLADTAAEDFPFEWDLPAVHHADELYLRAA